MDKSIIEELVANAADILSERCHIDGNDSYRQLAIDIFKSHPNLALIRGDMLSVDTAIKRGYIIPLADALKEADNG